MIPKFDKNKFYDLTDLENLFDCLREEEYQRSLEVQDSLFKQLKKEKITKIPGVYLDLVAKCSKLRSAEDVARDVFRIILRYSAYLKAIEEGKCEKYD